MKLKLPIRGAYKPRLTQGFGETGNAAFYTSNGLPPAHNGADFVAGTNQQTYGTELVCPLPYAYLSKRTWDTPLSTKGNGITIGGTVDGKEIQIVLWHLSEVAETTAFKEGWTLGYIGNSGLCFPAHSYTDPYMGSHLHLMVYENDGKNWNIVDPAKYFNYDTWYEGKDTGAIYDFAPVKFYMEKWIASARAFLGI